MRGRDSARRGTSCSTKRSRRGRALTLGSVLLALISIQLLTGAFLTLYYAPTPDHAYESVRFISSTTPGRLVRGLHHFGASFLVVFLVTSPAARRRARVVQAAAGSDVVVGTGADGPRARVRAHRLSSSLGSARVLGDGGDDQHLASDAGRGRGTRRGASGRIGDWRIDADALVLGARHLPAGAPRRPYRRAPRADAAAGELGPGAPEEWPGVSLLSLPGVSRHGCRFARVACGLRPGVARHAGARGSGRPDRRQLHSAARMVNSSACSSS